MVPAELVIEAARAGRTLDCEVAGEPGVVEADLLRSLCRERRDEVDDRGLSLRNAVIAGALDLNAVTVGFPLRLAGCRFENRSISAAARWRSCC